MRKRILILSNHFITLYNFRKELIHKLIEENHEVFISMPKSDENQYFRNLGCEIIETNVDRRGINPIRDLKLILDYIKIMKKVKPDIIFSYTIKPNIYGSIASNLVGYKQICNITGTGATFLKKNFVSEVAKILYKISVKYSYKVFFQNSGDKEYFVKNKMVKDNYEVIPGSGVNIEQYEFCKLPEGDEVNFIFIGRIMEVKGIDEYLKCAKAIKKRYSNVNFYVAGFIEEEKYKDIIEDYNNRGIIRYIGFQKDIKPWIRKCHCTVLPSHGGEGVPNVLLESAAMGRICIASKISGSKEVISDTETGFLFKVKDYEDLINKVQRLLDLDYTTRNNMGVIARERVENNFDRNIIIQKYLLEITII